MRPVHAKEHSSNWTAHALGSNTEADPFKTFGPPELCTWQHGPGVCRFQTTSPQFARKLSQRRGCVLVGYCVTERYLRVFQEEIEPWRARGLVMRYLKATNGAFLNHGLPQRLRKAAGRMVGAAKRKELFVGPLNRKNPPLLTTSRNLALEREAQGRVRS